MYSHADVTHIAMAFIVPTAMAGNCRKSIQALTQQAGSWLTNSREVDWFISVLIKLLYPLHAERWRSLTTVDNLE